MWSQNTIFSIKTVKIFKIQNNYKFFAYKCYTFHVNICPSLLTNTCTNRSFSFWGVIPVLSVDAYNVMDQCLHLLICISHWDVARRYSTY